jgi:hypothetical protein
LELCRLLKECYTTEEQKKDYAESAKTGILVGEALKSWTKYVTDWEATRHHQKTYGYTIQKPLRVPTTKQEAIVFVEENRGKVVGWMTFWFWSMVWTLLNDPIRKIMKHIFIQLKAWFVKIAMKTFGISN